MPRTHKHIHTHIQTSENLATLVGEMSPFFVVVVSIQPAAGLLYAINEQYEHYDAALWCISQSSAALHLSMSRHSAYLALGFIYIYRTLCRAYPDEYEYVYRLDSKILWSCDAWIARGCSWNGIELCGNIWFGLLMRSFFDDDPALEFLFLRTSFWLWSEVVLTKLLGRFCCNNG